MSREGRRPDELRALEIVPGFLDQADGSALISLGRTRVLCTATVEDEVPRWLQGKGQGWLTAEYGMLPASAGERIRREASGGAGELMVAAPSLRRAAGEGAATRGRYAG